MKYFIIVAFLTLLNAHAYCITNNSQRTLYFMVESYVQGDSVLSFKQYIKAKATKCCSVTNSNCNPTVNSKKLLSFYVFKNENSLEGCDIFGTRTSKITLKTYQDFDNCIWNKEK